MTDPTELFSGGHLSAFLRRQWENVRQYVHGLPEDQLLNSSVEAIVEHVVSVLGIEPLRLLMDSKSMQQEEVRVHSRQRYVGVPRVEVPGVRVTIDIPFLGDPRLWRLQPSISISPGPRGTILQPTADGGVLRVTIEQESADPAGLIKDRLDSTLRQISQYLASQEPEIRKANERLAPSARAAVESRRSALLANAAISDLIGIPLQRNAAAPEVSPPPLRRRIVRPLPTLPRTGFAPEPGISDGDYEHILSVIRHESATFEATPATYRDLGEEDLRNIILAHLNGHYQGDATGETFRGSGKSDIRIEMDNRAAFVAECKVWDGVKVAIEACEQLLGYLTWRDCKTALIIFNKTVADFSHIQAILPKELAAHGLCRSSIPATHAQEWRYRFAMKHDTSREVLLHVFAFNLFVRRHGA